VAAALQLYMNIEPYDQDVTDTMMSLLLMADPDEHEVKKYLKGSSILIAKDKDELIGIVVLVTKNGEFELINIAVKENYQGKGIAKLLIMEVMDLAKTMGATELFIGTGNSSFPQLALYQKCGFRMSHIKTDFFASYPEPIYENGIQCLDMVVLRVKL